MKSNIYSRVPTDIRKIPSSVFCEGRYDLFVYISTAVWAILTGASVEIFFAMRTSIEYYSENQGTAHDNQANQYKHIALNRYAAKGYDSANEQKQPAEPVNGFGLQFFHSGYLLCRCRICFDGIVSYVWYFINI